MSKVVTLVRRECLRRLLEHLVTSVPDAAQHIQAFMRHVTDPQARWYVAMLDHYNQCVEQAVSPMRSKVAWAALMGVPLPTLKRWWKALRAWRIGERFVFAEGAHAFRRGTVVKRETKGKRTRRVKVADPGICIRGSADPAFPLYAAREILQSTAETTRVCTANLGGAAIAIEQDAAASSEDVTFARATVAQNVQIPMDFGAQRKSA